MHPLRHARQIGLGMENEMMNAKFGRLACLAAAFLMIGCAAKPGGPSAADTPMRPTFEKREIAVLQFPNSDPNGHAITVERVAAAVAKAIPAASAFGPLQDGTKTYQGGTLSGSGYQPAGKLLWTERKGVQATVRPRNQIAIQYLNGTEHSNSRSYITATTAILEVTATSSTGQYKVEQISHLRENIARDMMFFPVKPLRAVDALQRDLEASAQKMKPTLDGMADEEIDLVAAPGQVMANLERVFGRPTNVRNDGEVREGRFMVDGTTIAVKAFAYKAGTKLRLTYPYKVVPDPSAPMLEPRVGAATARIKKVAAE